MGLIHTEMVFVRNRWLKDHTKPKSDGSPGCGRVHEFFTRDCVPILVDPGGYFSDLEDEVSLDLGMRYGIEEVMVRVRGEWERFKIEDLPIWD